MAKTSNPALVPNEDVEDKAILDILSRAVKLKEKDLYDVLVSNPELLSFAKAREDVLDVVLGRNPKALQFVSQNIPYDILQNLVRKDPNILQWMSTYNENGWNEQVKFIAVLIDRMAIRHIATQSPELQFAALRDIWQHTDEEIEVVKYFKEPTQDILVQIAFRCPEALKFIEHVPSKLQVQLVGVSEGRAIDYIKNRTCDAILAAIDAGQPDAIKYLQNPDEELQVKAVVKGGRNPLVVIDCIKQPCLKAWLAAAHYDAIGLARRKDAPGEALLEAVQSGSKRLEQGHKKNTWRSPIYWVKNPSEELQLAAVKANPETLLDIKNPTMKVQQEAVRKKPALALHLKNPAQELTNTLPEKEKLQLAIRKMKRRMGPTVKQVASYKKDFTS